MAEPKVTEPTAPKKPTPATRTPEQRIADADQDGPKTTHPPGGAKPRKDDAGRFIYETPLSAHMPTDADGRRDR